MQEAAMKIISKPMLDTNQQIEHLKGNGVTFVSYSEADARDYLRNNNNYFKLTSYRKNYEKYQGGANAGKYIALDFGYLRDMAIIDMELRYSFVQLALDIEHYAKLKILRMTEDHSEDGYQMCTDFMNTLDENQRERLKGEISRNEHSVYCGELFAKYPEHFPVWVFLEMIPFGRLVSFYGFCANRYCDSDMEKEYYMLMACKEIRNAAAHSSCILNNLHPETAVHEISWEIMSEIAKMKEISKSQRIKRMSNERMRQIITLLYTHKKIVTSAGVHQKSKKLMHAFDERMMRNIAYYQNNDLVRKTFEFLHRVIDNWF